MDRREVLRLLATGSLLQLAPTKLIAVLREERGLIQTQNPPRTLNAHQFATAKAMADMIIPRTDTAGAADAGVADFMDLMLTEWYDEAERTRFLTGLADVDSRTHALFGKDFVDCSSSQQSDILVNLGKDIVRGEKTGQRFTGRRAATPANFYVMFRDLTLTGYYTSEAGAMQELHFEMIPDHYDGCATEPTKQVREQR